MQAASGQQQLLPLSAAVSSELARLKAEVRQDADPLARSRLAGLGDAAASRVLAKIWENRLRVKRLSAYIMRMVEMEVTTERNARGTPAAESSVPLRRAIQPQGLAAGFVCCSWFCCCRYNKEGKRGRRVDMGVLFSCPADDYDPVDLQEEAPAPATSSTVGAGEPAPAILRARSSSAPGRSGSASTARSAKRLQPTRSRAARSFSAISSPPSRAGHGPASPSRSASPRWPLPAVFPPGRAGRAPSRSRLAPSSSTAPEIWVEERDDADLRSPSPPTQNAFAFCVVRWTDSVPDPLYCSDVPMEDQSPNAEIHSITRGFQEMVGPSGRVGMATPTSVAAGNSLRATASPQMLALGEMEEFDRIFLILVYLADREGVL
ncbi:unnamed protein product [Miscanthus lutarioriparius]|uniref:RDRP3-5 N-terminal domain-containing protein n=1 Tax=Miscanthus lutarioriparius TaxID=422564 RepID=A0A811SKU6_9POAL|nr:unnamed protein product [Miscanthus lutarioriparius]